MLWRSCDDDGRSRSHVRVGISAYLAFFESDSPDTAGFGRGLGGELEIDREVTLDLRLGVRASYEQATDSAALVTIGVRMHVDDRLFVATDLFTGPGNSGTTSGFLIGVGLEGKPGALTSAAELGLALLAGLALSQAR